MAALQEGDSVMLECSDEAVAQTRLQKGRSVKLFRQQVDHAVFMGLPDGAIIDISGPEPVQVTDGLLPPMEDLLGPAASDASGDPGHDNSTYVDDNSAQGLSVGEIRTLQHRGVTGAALIRHIASTSATFAQRSLYSKEKWIKVKQRRYMRRVKVTRLTARTMCAYVGHPRVELKGRPWTLRLDALSQMLIFSGVTAGSKALVLDDTAGQLTGALAERMGCEGALLLAYPGSRGGAQDQVLRWYNLPAPLDRFILQVPLEELAAGVDGEEVGWGAPPPTPPMPLPPPHDTPLARLDFLPTIIRPKDCLYVTGGGGEAPSPAPSSADTPGGGEEGRVGGVKRPRDDPAGGGGPMPPLRALKQSRRLSAPHARGALRSGMDCLVLAAKHDVTSTLLALLRWVVPGRPFVVFHWDIHVLHRAYTALMSLEVARCMHVFEMWSREYQMLPNRSHPAMNMDGASGFLLTGTVVANAYMQCKPEHALPAPQAGGDAGVPVGAAAASRAPAVAAPA